MNLFVERNAASQDVTLTLSVDNPALKSDLIINDISSVFAGKKLSIICTTGTPLFNLSFDSDTISLAQGACIQLTVRDDITELQLYDESPFGDPVATYTLNIDEANYLRKAVSDWVLALISV
jgi:hypothetical protein